MKINYNKNPLCTTIELEEAEKKELWYKIKINELQELLSEAALSLEEGKYFDIERARKEVNSDYYYPENNNEKSELDKRCDMLLEHYLKELQSTHCGDCTCVACSCEKCHAESLLGINTILGIGKHSTYKINGAFGVGNTKSIEEAIASLSTFHINPEDYKSEGWIKIGGYEQYVPRWEAETKVAHDWLVNYRNKHFNNNEMRDGE